MADMTIAEMWKRYDAKHARKLASYRTTEIVWKHLAPAFGSLTAVTQEDVDTYVESRGVSPSTCRRELGQLIACLNFNRVKIDVKLPADGVPRDRWLRSEEIKRLMVAAATMRVDDKLTRAERFLWLALETGGRKQALMDLTWDRVDFETNVIHLNIPGRIVTKKRRADVPISKTLRPILERAYTERAGEQVVGGVEIIKAVKAVAAKAKVPGVSPNVLRHTAATHMARKGVPLWIIAKVLGNSLAMVEKVYAKHCPDDLRAAVNLISGQP